VWALPGQLRGQGLSPRDLILKLDAHVWERRNGRALHGDVVSAAEAWACTTCRACSQVCPVFVDHLATIVELRRHLLAQPGVNAQLMGALGNLRRYGNSFGKSDRQRAAWTKGLEAPIKDVRKEPAQTLWFVGDYAAYNPALTDVTRATARVFRRAGLDFGLLYDAERNAGNDVRRVGEEGLFDLLALKNKAALGKGRFAEVVTTDPHTYNTLKNEYELSWPVYHYTEVLDQALAAGRLPVRRSLGYTVTYHDPCYLGRYNGVYAAPRRVLEAIGCRLVEMPRNRERGLCCGAGGGRIWMEEAPGAGERPAENRLREAAGLPGASRLVVACPKDLVMFRDAAKTTGLEERLAVTDLITLVDEATADG
jgi:Fe-S oxidoreductase